MAGEMAGEMAGRARHTWITVGWVGAVVATALNGLVVGYGSIWFQLFGETADAEDYRVSAGGYGAAAAVLALAALAILTHRGPRWLVWPTGAAAAVLGLLAMSSAAASRTAEPVASPVNTAWDGVGGVLWAPWTWALVALGVHGVYLLGGALLGRHRTGSDGRPKPDAGSSATT